MAKLLCVLLSLLVIFASLCNADKDAKCFRPTAALTTSVGTILFDNGRYIQFNSTYGEVGSGLTKDDIGVDGPVDAAVNYQRITYIFTGDHYVFFYFGITSSLKSISAWGHFFEGGIDAAGAVGGKTYFFKGCKYVTEPNVTESNSNEAIGLPCEVDASWYRSGKMYVTKGDNYWTMDENDQVDGPLKLADLLDLHSVELCREKTYEEKIEEELAYEKEHNCTILDAALTRDNTVYLFNNDEYVKLNEEGAEVEKEGIGEWGSLSGVVDAADVWSGNGGTYFFKGDHYYRYFSTWFGDKAVGPRGNELWGPFFLHGIDAAGNHNGQSFFFKGCKMALYPSGSKVSTVILNQDLNLPCHVDAAFSRGGTLYVIKGDRVWTWRADEEMPTGPAPLSTAVQLKSWTACA